MARLIILCVLFLLSLLCVYRAPALYLWYLAIMVTEFPWVFWILTTIVLLLGFVTVKYQLAGTIIGVAALILFLTPVIRAGSISNHLNADLDAAFGLSPRQNVEPFHLAQMFTGINTRQVAYETKVYSNASGISLTMDFYHAQLPGPRPCVVVVHGGSWAGGDSRQLPELNSVLAKGGYNVATINYRLAPQYHSPAQVEDLCAAITYLKHHAGELSIDTNNFVLLGRSAGAQIVSAAAYTQHIAGVKGVVSFYGPADMIWGYKHPASRLVFNSCQIIEDYFGGTYDEVPDVYKNGSPIEWVKDAHTLPTLLIHGPNDPLVAYEHSIRLEKEFKKYGVKYFFLSLPWATHGCDYTLNGPSGQLSTYTVKRFLEAVLK